MQSGAQIGSYRLEAPLPGDRVGELWRAIHVDLGQRVRLRVVQLPDAVRADVEEGLSRRSLPLTALHAPQLERYREAGVLPSGAAWLASDLSVGERLDERLLRDELSMEEAIDLGVELFKAVEALHEAGVAHGRIAPQRVVLTRTDALGGVTVGVKLQDAGVAHLLRLPGELGADPRCLAPEMKEGASPTLAADVFAAGRVLKLLGATAHPEVARIAAACTELSPDRRPLASSARLELAGHRTSPGPAAQVPVDIGTDDGWLGGWTEAPPVATTPAPTPAASATPAPLAGGGLGGWDDTVTGVEVVSPQAPPRRAPAAESRAFGRWLFVAAGVCVLAAVAFFVKARTVKPPPAATPAAGPAAAAEPSAPSEPVVMVDAAMTRDAAPLAASDGGAPDALDRNKAVELNFSPGGVRVLDVESGRALCEAADRCLVPIDRDLRVELEGHDPLAVSGDDLYDRRGGRWRLLLHPKGEQPERRRGKKRARRLR